MHLWQALFALKGVVKARILPYLTGLFVLELLCQSKRTEQCSHGRVLVRGTFVALSLTITFRLWRILQDKKSLHEEW